MPVDGTATGPMSLRGGDSVGGGVLAVMECIGPGVPSVILLETVDNRCPFILPVFRERQVRP